MNFLLSQSLELLEMCLSVKLASLYFCSAVKEKKSEGRPQQQQSSRRGVTFCLTLMYTENKPKQNCHSSTLHLQCIECCVCVPSARPFCLTDCYMCVSATSGGKKKKVKKKVWGISLLTHDLHDSINIFPAVLYF